MHERLFRAVELPSNEPVLYVGVYTTKWGIVDEPTRGFIPLESDELPRPAQESEPTVQELLDAIKTFDCEPSVFNVHLVAASHMSGYDATVYFRTYVKGAARSVSAHGDIPEEALEHLLNVLQTRWGRCPHCGQYLHGGVKEGGDTHD